MFTFLTRTILENCWYHPNQERNVSAGQARYVALYFSASWCPPCVKFTPVLRNLYQQFTQARCEIVLIPMDTDGAACASYAAKMPWPVLDLVEDAELVAQAQQAWCREQSIPRLVLLDRASGSTLRSDLATELRKPNAPSVRRLLADV